MLKAKLLGATAAAESLAIEDVFSTYLYTGDGSNGTSIVNNINLSGEGGLVWRKKRTSLGTINDHTFFDTERGRTSVLLSNSTAAAVTTGNSITSFNNDGFTIVDNNSYGQNLYEETYCSWTFRKAPRFFDVVTYTGNGTAGRTIAHNLGVVPGCIIVKQTNASARWVVYHRSLGATEYLQLDKTAVAQTYNGFWNDTSPTSNVFTVGNDSEINGSGSTYVAYLFAHDPLGPSGDGSDGLIACGSYTTDGNGDATVNLGWEPQWLLVKASNTISSWHLLDIMRGMSYANPVENARIFPNSSSAESSTGGTSGIAPTANGFIHDGYIAANAPFIYIAIRRGPMREPTSGTEVFSPVAKSVDNTFTSTGHVVDLLIESKRTSPNTTYQHLTLDRLRGTNALTTFSTAAEYAGVVTPWFSSNTGFNPTNFYAPTTGDYMFWAFRRAPGFFDVVAYTGNGTAGRTVPHNLGVAPEFMIVKRRDDITNWFVYVSALPNASNNRLGLNLDVGGTTGSTLWNDTEPTSTEFTLGSSSSVNASGGAHIAYLFATLPGVSKVGSYTGNGSNQTINCGFTSGARFILIKRTDSTGDWYVWDTARGIVTGNDPHLSLNTTAAEVTSNDTIDPDSTGFIVNQVAATNVNVSSASYIYFAVS